MNQFTINGTVIEIFVGDLINADYDAIAIPTNSRLLPSGTLRCRVLNVLLVKYQMFQLGML